MHDFNGYSHVTEKERNSYKVTYIYHSGFAVELETCVLLFDYYKGELPHWEKEKPIYVFVSHKHGDHFSLKIFDLVSQYDNVHFFLSSDVKLSEKYLEKNHISPAVKEKITTIGKNQKLSFPAEEAETKMVPLTIETLRSTDEGVAFIVEIEGRTLYHAGDLNWWHWEGEPSPFNEDMERDYKKEIDDINGRNFDLAFVPLDPRLGDAYGLGMDYFLSHTEAKRIFPMHLWEEYGYIGKYKCTEIGSRFNENIIEISAPGQEFKLWNI